MRSFSSILLIFVLTTTFLINENSSSLQNITCNKNDFRLSIRLTQIDGLDVTFLYDLALTSQETLVSANVTFNEYIQACITSIVCMGVQVRPAQEAIFFLEKMPVTNATTFYNQITTLTPLATYNFSFGYEQKQQENETLILNSTEVSACFGSPDKPSNLRQVLLSDGSVMVEWSEPSVIRAPYLCYYLVEKNSLVNKTRIKQNSLYYIVGKSELENRPQIRISAYNEAYCYEEEFSFVKTCRPNVTSDSSDWIRVDGNITATTMTPLTTHLNNSAFVNNFQTFSFLRNFFFSSFYLVFTINCIF